MEARLRQSSRLATRRVAIASIRASRSSCKSARATVSWTRAGALRLGSREPCSTRAVLTRSDEAIDDREHFEAIGVHEQPIAGNQVAQDHEEPFVPAGKEGSTRKMPSPRGGTVIWREKLCSPAGRRPICAQKAKPPRGKSTLPRKISCPRRPIRNISVRMSIPRGGLAFSSPARRPPAGEGDFSMQEPIPRRGISFLTVALPSPRGGKAFFSAGADPPAGN